MSDYIFEVPLTNEGRDIVADPDVLDSIISEGSYMISRVTYNNITVETVDFDSEARRIYYGVAASPQMKLGLATGDLAWWNTLIAGVAIAGAVACVIAFGAPAIIPAAVVIGVALAYDVVTGYIEVEATKADTQEVIAEAVADGTITPDEGKDLANAVKEGWASGVPWTGIIVGGMVGALALGALYIYIKKKK